MQACALLCSHVCVLFEEPLSNVQPPFKRGACMRGPYPFHLNACFLTSPALVSYLASAPSSSVVWPRAVRMGAHLHQASASRTLQFELHFPLCLPVGESDRPVMLTAQHYRGPPLMRRRVPLQTIDNVTPTARDNQGTFPLLLLLPISCTSSLLSLVPPPPPLLPASLPCFLVHPCCRLPAACCPPNPAAHPTLLLSLTLPPAS